MILFIIVSTLYLGWRRSNRVAIVKQPKCVRVRARGVKEGVMGCSISVLGIDIAYILYMYTSELK